MQPWILVIIMLGSTSQSGKSVSMQEMTTQKNCEAARHIIYNNTPKGNGTIYLECVPK